MNTFRSVVPSFFFRTIEYNSSTFTLYVHLFYWLITRVWVGSVGRGGMWVWIKSRPLKAKWLLEMGSKHLVVTYTVWASCLTSSECAPSFLLLLVIISQLWWVTWIPSSFVLVFLFIVKNYLHVLSMSSYPSCSNFWCGLLHAKRLMFVLSVWQLTVLTVYVFLYGKVYLVCEDQLH